MNAGEPANLRARAASSVSTIPTKYLLYYHDTSPRNYRTAVLEHDQLATGASDFSLSPKAPHPCNE